MNREHGSGPSPLASAPEPTLAERAKTLVTLGGFCSLSTMSEKFPGYPFGSVMPFGLDHRGSPTFLISAMAMHTQNIKADPRATLLIHERSAKKDSLGLARVSLVGDVEALNEEASAAVREPYLDSNPESKYWVNFGDFAFFRLNIIGAYYIGGFGVMGWVEAEDYYSSAPDPLAAFAQDIIQHMNEDHRPATMMIAKHFAGIDAKDAQLTAVDRLGFNIRVETDEGVRGGRIGFPKEVRDSNEVRKAFIEMVKEAGE